jgi:hypothetical protein
MDPFLQQKTVIVDKSGHYGLKEFITLTPPPAIAKGTKAEKLRY